MPSNTPTKRAFDVAEDHGYGSDTIVLAPPKRAKQLGSAPPSRSPLGNKHRRQGADSVPSTPRKSKVRAPLAENAAARNVIASPEAVADPESEFEAVESRTEDDEDDEVREQDLEFDADYVDEEEAALAAALDDVDEDDSDVAGGDAPDVDVGSLSPVNIQRFSEHVRSITKEIRDACLSISVKSEGVRWADQPFTRVFWSTCIRSTLDNLVQVYLDAVPDSVKHILGQDQLDVRALCSLPSAWRGVSNPGVYADFVTSPQGCRPYVGSATMLVRNGRKAGLWARLHQYVLAQTGNGRKEELKHAHLRNALKEDSKMNLRVIAKFPMGTSPFYVISFETVMMIFLRTLRMNTTPHTWCPVSCFELVRKTTPHGLPKVPWTENCGLNGAISINQNRMGRKPGDRFCVICSVTFEDRIACGENANNARKWYSLESGRPQTNDLCWACYVHGYIGNDHEGNFNLDGNSCQNCKSGDIDVCFRDPKNRDASAAHLLSRYLCHKCVTFAVKYKFDRPGTFWDTSVHHPCSNCGTVKSSKFVSSLIEGVLRCAPCQHHHTKWKQGQRNKAERSAPFKQQDGVYHVVLDAKPGGRSTRLARVKAQSSAGPSKSSNSKPGKAPAKAAKPRFEVDDEEEPEVSRSEPIAQGTRKSSRRTNRVDYRELAGE